MAFAIHVHGKLKLKKQLPIARLEEIVK